MEHTLYLGSYTKKASKGVHQITLNTETQQLVDYKLIAEVDTPTYLTFSDDKKTMYTISKEENGGGLTAFDLDENGDYVKRAATTSEDSAPCYISYDQKRGLLFTANYHGGFVTVYKEQEDGRIVQTDRKHHQGSSVHENQASPHVHYTDYAPGSQTLLVCDLGTDTIVSYDVSDAGELSERATYTAKAGSGPRHLVFHPNNKTAYLVCELSNEIEILTYDEATASFTYVDRVATIPDTHTSFNSGAAIRVSNDGKFVYFSNRGHDSIAVFAISEDGQSLELLEIVPTEGKTPRDFNFSPDELYVIVGHQDSDNLTLFKRDQESGRLTLLDKETYAAECVCVTF